MKQGNGLQRLRQAAGGIRGKFLVYFIIGTVLLLSLASLLSYRVMAGSVQRINERTANSEFAQISVNLQSLYDNINRQIDALLFREETQMLLRYDEQKELDIIYAISDFSKSVTNIISNFPYVHSVYLFLDDGRALCATASNMRRFIYDWSPRPSNTVVEQVLTYQGRHMALVGGLTDRDYPLAPLAQQPEQNLISAIRTAKGGRLVINLFEEHFSTLYLGIAENDSSIIRLVGADGNVLSSWNKEELGRQYAYFNELPSPAANGQLTDWNAGMQVLWFYLSGARIWIANEIELNVYWKDLSDVVGTVLITFLAGLILLCAFFMLWMNRVLAPLGQLSAGMRRVGETGAYDQVLPVPSRREDELTQLVRHFNRMLRDLQELTQRQKQTEEEKRRSELRALRNQINPHFLFNTLNNIKWMGLLSGSSQVAECITALGGIIQPMFRTDDPLCSLEEELQSVRLYLQIMNIRYENGIVYEEEVEEGLKARPVLRFILQPIFENAISHGFRERNHHGVICLRASRDGGLLRIQVLDDGQGLSDRELSELNQRLLSGEGGGIGLLNTSRRLALHYGPPCGVQLFHNPGGGLCAVLTLPLEEIPRSVESGQ